MATRWFLSNVVPNNCGIERTDYVFTGEVNVQSDIPDELVEAIFEYFRSQRLPSEEIERWDQAMAEGDVPTDLGQGLLLAFVEGITGDDSTLDEDAYLGTFTQMVFRWIRKSFLGSRLVDCEPVSMTDSSTSQGIDYFEIVGDGDNEDSLHFIIWEIKGTDGSVRSRTNEIYQQHRNRSERLIRGLQKKLCDRYEAVGHVTLRAFAGELFRHWGDNTSKKRIGGCIVYDSHYRPRTAFTTFATRHFPNLADDSCRQVCLVEIPCFRDVRSMTLERIWQRLGLVPPS